MNGSTISISDRGGRLYLRWFADDSDLWRRILDDFKARFPTHADRCYHAGTKTWSVPARQRRRLEEWVCCWFPAAGQQWDTDNDDDSDGEDEPKQHRTNSSGGQSSHGREGHQQPYADTLDAAYAALHLRSTAPPALVTAAYRIAAQCHHPDHGGASAAMVAVNSAVAIIRVAQRQEAQP